MSDEFFDIDFEKVEILRGETPEDIIQKCLVLCKDYLGGIWAKISVENIELQRITGGFSNQIYHCALKQSVEPIGDEPREVALRFYGEKQSNLDCETNNRINDAIISVLMSEHNLGPKIYGIFPDGEIQQYCKVSINLSIFHSFISKSFKSFNSLKD
jgi:choline/ethanolamine kinase